jgi:hypothetical protein
MENDGYITSDFASRGLLLKQPGVRLTSRNMSRLAQFQGYPTGRCGPRRWPSKFKSHSYAVVFRCYERQIRVVLKLWCYPVTRVSYRQAN